MNTFIFLFCLAIMFFVAAMLIRNKIDEHVGEMLGAVIVRDAKGTWLTWPHLLFMCRLPMPVDGELLERVILSMTSEEEIGFMTQSPAVAKTYAESEGREATILLIQQEKEYVNAERAKAADIGAYLGSYDHHLRQIELTLKSLS